MPDAVVIGGGPAGLAAATWLARYRRSTVLLDAGQQRNLPTEHVHGYVGFDGSPPQELLERARAHLEAYGTVDQRAARAVEIEAGQDVFVVHGDDGAVIEARRVVLATGVEDVLPDIAGFHEHYGASAFHCPTCDGYEARDRRVVVLGGGEHLRGFARALLNWAASVTIVSDAPEAAGDDGSRERLMRDGIVFIDQPAVGLTGRRGALESVVLGNGARVETDLVFFSTGHRPRTHLARALGCALDDGGHVAVDLEGRTSVEGVFAAGDLTPGPQLVQVAAAKGAAAGIACARSLD